MEITLIHKRLLELLAAFDRLCQDHGIDYSLHGGTLLGAVREKGFIPWDDDADVTMTREQYEKLLKALEGNAAYHIVGSIKKQFRKIGDTDFWVDIFICDYISPEPLAKKCKLLSLTVLDIMNRDKHTIKLSDLGSYSRKKRLVFKMCYHLGKLLTPRCKQRLYEKVSRKRYLGDKSLYLRSNDQYQGRRILMPAQWLTSYQRVPFDGITLSVTTHYRELLTSIYGEDFMTPVKDTRNHQVHDLVRGKKEELSL